MAARSFVPGFVKKAVWNFKFSRSKDWAGRPSPDHAPADLVQVLLHNLQPEESVLDFGCGVGNLFLALRRGGWHGHYIGVDISDLAIARAKELLTPGAEWHVSSIEQFPLRSADNVVFCESLYYAKDVSDVIARWSKSRIYARIVHAERHADAISKLSGFRQDGPVYYRFSETPQPQIPTMQTK